MNGQATTETERRFPDGQLPEAPRRAGWKTGTAVVLLALVVAGMGVLYFVDPHQHHLFPSCPFHELTGWNCPGCGATRAGHALLHGHLLTALHDNALFVLALPVAGAFVGWAELRQRAGKPRWRVAAGWQWLGLGVLLLFTVWRNLPSGAWLSP